MNKHIGIGVIALGLLLSVSFAAPAQAAGLTEVQITAVINLVASFGADATTVKNVEASLRGQAAQGTAVTPTSPASPCVTLYQDISVGSQDSHGSTAVADLQSFLGINPVGYFGMQTKAAVKQWQTSHGISAIGIVGPATRAAMACK